MTPSIYNSCFNLIPTKSRKYICQLFTSIYSCSDKAPLVGMSYVLKQVG